MIALYRDTLSLEKVYSVVNLKITNFTQQFTHSEFIQHTTHTNSVSDTLFCIYTDFMYKSFTDNQILLIVDDTPYQKLTWNWSTCRGHSHVYARYTQTTTRENTARCPQQQGTTSLSHALRPISPNPSFISSHLLIITSSGTSPLTSSHLLISHRWIPEPNEMESHGRVMGDSWEKSLKTSKGE